MLAGIALAAGLLAGAVGLESRAQDGLYQTGQKVEAAKVVDLDGKAASLADLKGKTIVINFFSRMSGGCNAEAPRLEKEIWQRYKDKGVAVVGVSRDADGGRKFKQRHGLTFPIWIDEKDVLFSRFVDTYIPWNVVIDPSGTVRYTKAGFESEKAEEIKKLLDELTRS